MNSFQSHFCKINKIPIFVALPKNLEPLFLDEMRELGIRGFKSQFLGAEAELHLGDIYKIVYQSRLASRIQRPLIYLEGIDSPETLYQKLMDYAWEELIPADKTFVIQASVRDSKLTHSQYAGQLLKDAICDRNRELTGKRPSVDKDQPQISLELRIRGSKAVVSVLYSTQSNFRRNYRKASVEAPLKENLAHAVLRFANWEPGSSLVDLCVGSGTFLIEAAMWATNTPAGYYKNFHGFEFLPDYDDKLWTIIREKADKLYRPIPKGRLWGTEIEPEAYDVALDNIEFAGFQNEIRILRKNCLDFSLPQRALVIANLPYGERLSEEKRLYPFYGALGDYLVNQLPNGRAVLLASNPILEKALRLQAHRRLMIDNGDLDVAVTEYVCA